MLCCAALESAKDDPIVYGTTGLELVIGRHTILADDHGVLASEGCGGPFDCGIESLVNLVETLSAQGRIGNFHNGRLAHDRALHRELRPDNIEFRGTRLRRELTADPER
jgi:hypothetical protein